MKEELAESIAEDLIFDLKTMFSTDLTYRFLDEESGVMEIRHTPKGEVLKNKFVKTILNHLNNEAQNM